MPIRSSLLIGLALMLLVLSFTAWVWSLRWHYRTLSPGEIQAQQGLLPGPLFYHGIPVTHFRENRSTHEVQAKMGNMWIDVPERM